jgi:mitogen-activated protein kinase 1/3
MFPKANPLAVDLMERCLTFSPRKRITVEEALTHPYLGQSRCPCLFCWTLMLKRPCPLPEPYHDPSDEPTAEPLDPSFFDFDYTKEQLSRSQLKQLIYQEIIR